MCFMFFEQLIYEKVFLQLRSHISENGWTTDKSRLLKYLLQQNLFSAKKKTANNIFKSHKKHKNIQNIPVFVKVSS